MNNPTLGEFCFTMKRASYPCGNFSDTFSCFKKFLLTRKRVSYRARKSMYDVHQTCIRGSSNLYTWFIKLFSTQVATRKLPLKISRLRREIFFRAESLPTDSHCALRDPRHSILPLSLSATTRSFYHLKTSHIGLSPTFFFENFSKLDSNLNKEEHFEKIKIEKLLNKSNSQRQIDDRLS